MNRLPPIAAALAALALSACQDKPAAEAVADPAVAAAVADARTAAFDPVTGKARDPAGGFAAAAAAPPPAAVAPASTLSDKSMMSRTLDAPRTETIGGETAF